MNRLRMCIACKTQKDKKELFRVVKSKDGLMSVDTTHKKEGRGAYVCGKECLAKCKKSKLLNRAFKCDVLPQVYQMLEEEIEKNNE